MELLLDPAKRCERQGPDAKGEASLERIYRLQAEAGDPDLKPLVFTEFVPAHEMLYEFLTERSLEVVWLNGPVDMDERERVGDAFAKDGRILISRDGCPRGLNLQLCHVVYDIPWNPMRAGPRIDRVARIEQVRTVRAISFVLEGPIEHRVRKVLEKKLALPSVVSDELGTASVHGARAAARTRGRVRPLQGWRQRCNRPSRLGSGVRSRRHFRAWD